MSTVSADSSGRFAASLMLAPGAHPLTATATDLAGNSSPASALVNLTVAAASSSAPLYGAAGKLQVTSVWDQPDPFIPARGEVSELRVEAALARSTGAQVGQQYVARLERVVSNASGTPVRTITTEKQVPVSTGGSTAMMVSAIWDGRRTDGSTADAGRYRSSSTFSIIKQPRPGNSGTTPPDCRSGSLSGPCVLDRIVLATEVTLVAIGPGTRNDYLTDPALSASQRLVLCGLEQQSSSPVFVQSWPRAGTIYRLDLEAPSGALSTASLEEHGRAFLGRNLVLWGLQSIGQLSVFDNYPGGDCSAVTFQLQQDGVPVFNATLTVVVTAQGIVRSVTGRMSGTRFPVQQGHLTPVGARVIATDALGWPEDLPDLPRPVTLPSPVVFDPFFAFDGPHEAQSAFLFSDSTGPMGPAGLSTRWPTGVVVGGASGVVEFAGPTFDPSQTAFVVPRCGFSDATAWAPEVVLDPLTNTPAWVNLHHMGGLKVSGTTDVLRAYSFLSLPQAKYLWGDAAPREHLRDAVVNPIQGGGRQVTFREYQAGIPVDGAYLSVVLGRDDRVVAALARFVHFPGLPPPGANPIPLSVARATTDAYWASAECGADAQCRCCVARPLSRRRRSRCTGAVMVQAIAADSAG